MLYLYRKKSILCVDNDLQNRFNKHIPYGALRKTLLKLTQLLPFFIINHFINPAVFSIGGKMKTSLKKQLLTLAVIACVMSVTTVHAQTSNNTNGSYDNDAETEQPSGQTDAYSVWCDQVAQDLNQAQVMGWQLYHRQLYGQAKGYIMNALQQAIASMNIPGSAYRPATFREIQRTILLVGSLESTDAGMAGVNSTITLKEKMIAYVALQRISFITYVKDTVDVSYNIPCHRGYSGYGMENREYEGALAMVASEQLSRAQDYSSIVGADGMVYPINDTPYYFVIIAKAARWAAEDLSTSLFNKRFSCPIMKLRQLGSEAATDQAMLGDVAAVQLIHEKVEFLEADLGESTYGCSRHY